MYLSNTPLRLSIHQFLDAIEFDTHEHLTESVNMFCVNDFYNIHVIRSNSNRIVTSRLYMQCVSKESIGKGVFVFRFNKVSFNKM